MPHLGEIKNIVEIRGIGYSYGKERVLRDITFDIHEGDYLGVVGPNGSGKTTLLKIMLGLIRPSEGHVLLFGQDVTEFRDWSRIGYVPQKVTNFDANFPATVLEVVLMGRYARRGLFGGMTKQDRQIALRSLEHVGMSEYRNRLIGDLSGGQQQRVFIARALAGKPEIIFLDEPTTGIDERAQADFYALLKKLNEKMGLTLVLVSHDIAMVTKEVMHIACIDRTLVCHMSPQEFVRESAADNIFGQEVKVITHHRHGH